MASHEKLISKVYDNIKKSEDDSRLYRGLALSNGMQVLLVSDPLTDKSSAALKVLAGSMHDPRDLPGIAHFCEHMLFLGTKKYPIENEYHKFLQEHGGGGNAHTSNEYQSYYFDVSPDSFKHALDRFAQFFYHPLFTKSAVEREVNAVDLEHKKNLQSDVWRLTQLNRSTGNPDHDFSKFATGNFDTLYEIPKLKGINIREELVKFHKKFYSANLMGLVVYGKENLDELTKMVVPLFSKVVNKNLPMSEWKHNYDSEYLKLQGYTVPIRDFHGLTVVFPLHNLRKYFRCCPGRFLGHLVGHEGPGSLFSEIKKKGWANGLVAGAKEFANGICIFELEVTLTEEGLDHVNEIITMFFQYLEMLKQEGIQEWIFQECKMLDDIQFRFKDKEIPIVFTETIAKNMFRFPMEELLRGEIAWDDFQPEVFNEVLNLLIPDRMRILVVSKLYEDICTETEKWYGTKYKYHKIKEETLDQWRNLKPHPNLKLPPPNELIPSNLDIIPKEEENSKYPVLLKNTKMGCLWYKQDDTFQLPKAILKFEIESPLVYVDPLHYNMNTMYLMFVKDAFNEYAYSGELTDLNWSLSVTKVGIMISIKAFNDKLHLFLRKLMETLTTLKINEKRFHILKQELKRYMINFRTKQPHEHATYYTSMLLIERSWTNDELLSCIDEITIEAVQEMIPRVFAKVHIEALIHGNLNKKQALTLMNIVETVLKVNMRSNYLMPSQFIRQREFQLTDGCHYVYEIMNEVHGNSAIENYYQCGIEDTRANVLLGLLVEMISEPCFTYLRTQEQLGYILSANVRSACNTQGLRIILQSDKSPTFVDSKIETFVQMFDKYLQDLTDEEFKNHVNSLSLIRLTKPTELEAESSKYWREISSRQYNFDRDTIEVECLRTISKDDLYSFFKEMIACDAPKRKKLSVHVVPKILKSAGDEIDGKYPCVADEGASSDDGLIPPPPGFRPPIKIENVVNFKNSLALYPLLPPSVAIPSPFPNVPERSKL